MNPPDPLPSDGTNFFKNLEVAIIDPLITLLALAAFVVFVWGVVEFIRGADNQEARSKGQKHIIWGLIGLTIIFGARAILALINTTVSGFN